MQACLTQAAPAVSCDEAVQQWLAAPLTVVFEPPPQLLRACALLRAHFSPRVVCRWCQILGSVGRVASGGSSSSLSSSHELDIVAIVADGRDTRC